MRDQIPKYLGKLHHLDEKPTTVDIYCSKGSESSGVKMARGVRSVMGPVQECGVVDD